MDRYSPSEVEFFKVFGLCFVKAEGLASQDRYLALNIKTSKLFHDSKTPFAKRTAEIFFRYIKPLLKIIAEDEVLDNPLIAGIALSARWQVKKLFLDKYKGILLEKIQLIVLKDDLNRNLSGEITDQQLLDRNSIFMLDEKWGNRQIAIKLE